MMDMPTRNQYLQTLIETHKYHTASKKEKSKLLDEYCINTGQKRKYVIWKIRNRTYVERERSRQRKRTQYYDGFVTSALARCWEIFDFPCGQRLAPLLKTEMARLRALGEENGVKENGVSHHCFQRKWGQPPLFSKKMGSATIVFKENGVSHHCFQASINKWWLTPFL